MAAIAQTTAFRHDTAGSLPRYPVKLPIAVPRSAPASVSEHFEISLGVPHRAVTRAPASVSSWSFTRDLNSSRMVLSGAKHRPSTTDRSISSRQHNLAQPLRLDTPPGTPSGCARKVPTSGLAPPAAREASGGAGLEPSSGPQSSEQETGMFTSLTSRILASGSKARQLAAARRWRHSAYCGGTAPAFRRRDRAKHAVAETFFSVRVRGRPRHRLVQE